LTPLKFIKIKYNTFYFFSQGIEKMLHEEKKNIKIKGPEGPFSFA